MDSNAPLTVESSHWTEEAAAVISAAVSHCPVEELQRQVESGAVLFRVSRAGETVGYYVLRVDRDAAGYEGVLVAAAGKDQADLTALLVPIIEKQFIGCRSIRIHTDRPGLAKKLTRVGYGGEEVIMRKFL